MLVTISSSALTVKIEDLGAQLASIRSLDGTEYLWQGDPNIWARRAPILFPVLGRLRDSRYLLDRVPYTIPTHGFARDSVFSVVEQAPDSVSFQLTDSLETLACYPFAFSLTVTYTLSGNRLTKTHRVENRSDREMLYELGAHDGFPGNRWGSMPSVCPVWRPSDPMAWTNIAWSRLRDGRSPFPMAGCRSPLPPMAWTR